MVSQAEEKKDEENDEVNSRQMTPEKKVEPPEELGTIHIANAGTILFSMEICILHRFCKFKPIIAILP